MGPLHLILELVLVLQLRPELAERLFFTSRRVSASSAALLAALAARLASFASRLAAFAAALRAAFAADAIAFNATNARFIAAFFPCAAAARFDTLLLLAASSAATPPSTEADGAPEPKVPKLPPSETLPLKLALTPPKTVPCGAACACC